MEIALQYDKNNLKDSIRAIKNSIFFKERAIQQLKIELEKKENQLQETIYNLINVCKHKWEDDYIDSLDGYKLSRPIRYCAKCELTDCTNS